MSTSFSTGISKAESGYEAGKKAALSAKEKLGTEKIDLVVVFGSLKYHLGDICNGIRDVAGDAPIIGASSSGEFTEEKADKESVAVSMISSDTHKFFISSAEGLRENTYEKVRECIADMPKEIEGFPFRSAIVFHDGLIGRGERIVSLLRSAFSQKITFAGGAAGDDLQFKETYVIHNDRVMKDAMVLAMVASKEKIGLGVEHGHIPVSDKLEVTKSKENVLYHIDGKPAWDVWREQLKDIAMKNEGIDVYSLKTASEIGSFLLKYEMGLSLGDDRYKVRVPLSVNEDGSMNFAVEIFEGAKFNIMYSIKDKQIESARLAAQYAKEDVGGSKIAGALIFDCVCRGLILGDQFYDAVKEMRNIIGNDTPLCGFETYGEICMNDKQLFSGFHNTTSVVMLFPD